MMSTRLKTTRLSLAWRRGLARSNPRVFLNPTLSNFHHTGIRRRKEIQVRATKHRRCAWSACATSRLVKWCAYFRARTSFTQSAWTNGSRLIEHALSVEEMHQIISKRFQNKYFRSLGPDTQLTTTICSTSRTSPSIMSPLDESTSQSPVDFNVGVLHLPPVPVFLN